MRIGPQELIIVLVIVLIIFGPKNLPKLGKMFGKTMKGFKDGINEDDEEEAKPAGKTEKAEKNDSEE